MDSLNIAKAQPKYAHKNLVTFSLKLGVQLNKKGQIKKAVKPPNNFPNFDLVNCPPVKKDHNALGMLCGQSNDIFVIDVDKVNDFDQFLIDNNATFNFDDSIIQDTANGGFHLFFQYESDFDIVKGKDHCFGEKYAIDSRTNGNFIYVSPTMFIGEISDEKIHWQYKWRSNQSILEKQLPLMPKFMKEHLFTYRGGKGKSKLKNNFLPPPKIISNKNYLENDQHVIFKNFCIETFKINANDIREIHFNNKKYSLNNTSSRVYKEVTVALNTRYCSIAGREHTSNHQFILIDCVYGARLLCHDNQCDGKLMQVASLYLPNSIKNILDFATTTNTLLDSENSEMEPELENCRNRADSLIFPIDDISPSQIVEVENTMIEVDSDVPTQEYTTDSVPKKKKIKVGRANPLTLAKENVVKNIMEAKCEDDPEQPLLCKMKYTLGNIVNCPFGGPYESALIHNLYCPIHKKEHDKAENFVRLDSQGQKYIMCKLDPGAYYPDPVATIPQNQLNIIYQDMRQTNIYNTYNNSAEVLVNQTILPSEFEEDGLSMFIDNNELRQIFLRALDGNHHSIANLYYYLNKNKYRCLGRNDTWFEFEGHIWVDIKADLIRAQLSDSVFLRPFEEALVVYRQNPALRSADKKAKKIDNLLQQLLTDSFLNHVVHQCETIFYTNHRHFEKNLNTANITPFNNGVLDLTTLQFRDGKPEDCMTLSTKIDYIQFDPNDSIVKEIMLWFEEAQPDSEQRLYLQKLISSFLTKDTHWQQIWVFTGSGQNGKSFFIERILRPVLGDFFGTAATQLLTRKRENANETNEALINILKKRVAIFSEPAQNEILQADILKNITGEDHITARGNYQSQQDVSPDFKAIIVCNTIPKVSEDSYAVWRRIRVIDWPMTFKNNPDCNNPLEKQLDMELGENVKHWPPYFAGCMVYWLNMLRQDPTFDPPPAVTRHTNQYKEDNDQFLDYRIQFIKKGKTNDFIQWQDLREHFRTWYNNLHPNAKLSARPNHIKSYFNDKLGGFKATTMGSTIVRGYIGWKFV